MKWVLAYDRTNDDGTPRPIYLHRWTPIGPMGTADVAEAERFASEQTAMMHPAYSFPLTFYRPREIDG